MTRPAIERRSPGPLSWRDNMLNANNLPLSLNIDHRIYFLLRLPLRQECLQKPTGHYSGCMLHIGLYSANLHFLTLTLTSTGAYLYFASMNILYFVLWSFWRSPRVNHLSTNLFHLTETIQWDPLSHIDLQFNSCQFNWFDLLWLSTSLICHY